MAVLPGKKDMFGGLDFEPPSDWNRVAGQCVEGFSMPEKEQIAREFQEIDVDRNGGLDNIELRRCQELDDPITFVQMQNALRATGLAPPLSLEHWFILKAHLKKRELVWDRSKGLLKQAPKDSVKLKDASSKGKKSYFEQLAARQQEENERMAVLAAGGGRKGREDDERIRREKEEAAAKKALKEKRQSFKSKFSQWEQS